ncbi:hypothetical protein Franean1_3448 [Parafrankia sp. EAN1pec]|nr:hypothetical protein Franean1_3448 [Frankia sp. EAN1pec]
MNDTGSTPPAGPATRPFALRAVTMLIGSVVALSFLFGLGNVWSLGIRLGVPAYIAPLNPRGFTRSEGFSARTRGSVGAWTGG